VTEEELEELAAKIALKTWQRIRRMIHKQQREIFDLMEDQ
jgi:hypothetical protein